jgi:hypothetical protein
VNVHSLPDRALLDARSNLATLVARARSLAVFGPSVDFDAPIWNLSKAKPARPSAMQTSRLYFTRHALHETRSMEGRVAFGADFANMLKSMVALREFSRASSPGRYKKLVQAARYLYETIENRGFDPAALVSSDFIAACAAADGKSGSVRYQTGQDLEEIAAFINKHALAKARMTFKSGRARGRHSNRSDDKARAARASKMPSEELIDAVIATSEAVRERGRDPDILRVAIVELLMCAPWRINELLNLLLDCVRTEIVTDHLTGGTNERFGIAYGGSKGANDAIKWIPTPMVEIAQRALADIRRITQPARDVALWMETHPGRAFLAEPWRMADPDTTLTMTDAANTLALASDEASTYWLKANKVPVAKRDGRFRGRMGDLEAAVLRLQPKLPPGRPSVISEYLLLVPNHYFREDMATMPAVVTFVTDAQVGGFLSTKKRHKSVFQRLRIHDANDKPYVITSHCFRHYLNTIAQDGELPQLDIARWSGRKRIEQNAAYDHSGGMHLGRRMQQVLRTDAMRGPIATTFDKLPPADRDGFLKARLNTAHTTDIGMCVQDWSMAPCPSHGACASCSDHLVIKGHAVHKARAERLLGEHESMLAQAKTEMDEGTYGASDWVAHNETMVVGLKNTIAVHTNAEITDGAVVQPQADGGT